MKFKIMLLIIVVSIVIVLCFFPLNTDIRESISILEGTWVLYEGGQPAPDVMTFMSNGTGMCYELSDQLSDSSWVRSGLVESEFLLNPQPIIWEASEIAHNYSKGNDMITMMITIQIGQTIKKFKAILEPNLAGTGRYGLYLISNNNTEGGWIKIEKIR